MSRQGSLGWLSDHNKSRSRHSNS